jgi:hypothetical protein
MDMKQKNSLFLFFVVVFFFKKIFFSFKHPSIVDINVFIGHRSTQFFASLSRPLSACCFCLLVNQASARGWSNKK